MKTLCTLLFLCLTLTGQVLAQEEAEKPKPKKGTRNHFNIDLGINNVLQDGEFPNDNDALYAVKPWGSWYVALKSVNDTYISGPLHLKWGPEVNWYNFKFENEDVRLAKDNGQVVFSEANDVESQKSKLTAAFLGFSAVPMLQFGDREHNHKRYCNDWVDLDMHGHDGTFRIGAGGYVGYKMASYTKTVSEVDGDKKKDKDKGGYYLNSLRYGVRLQMGFKDVDVFFNYDLNPLFAEDRGPELNAFSFGVVL